jgi:hypothetical protein
MKYSVAMSYSTPHKKKEEMELISSKLCALLANLGRDLLMQD